jgi:hypothetical protein
MEEKSRIYDYTTLDTFLTCRRKYYWMICRKIRPKYVASALEFGTAVHASLAAYYTQGLDEALKVMEKSFVDREGEDLRTVANGKKMVSAYADKYKNEPFKIMQFGGKPAVEIGFAVPLGKVMYAGRLDALVDWNGEMFVLEHKSTTRMDSGYFKQFSPNMQVDGYIYGAGAYTGRKCAGCVVNGLELWKDVKKPTYKTKAPEDHFARDPQSRNEAQLNDFAQQVNLIVEDIDKCESKGCGIGDFYQNKHSCRNYNSDCPYRTLCMYGENERILESDYRVEAWEPYKQAVEE